MQKRDRIPLTEKRLQVVSGGTIITGQVHEVVSARVVEGEARPCDYQPVAVFPGGTEIEAPFEVCYPLTRTLVRELRYDHGSRLRRTTLLDVFFENQEWDPNAKRYHDGTEDGGNLTGEQWLFTYRLRRETPQEAMLWWLANRQWFYEHPIEWWRASSVAGVVGRKIWYRDVPAVIVQRDPEFVTLAVDKQHVDGWPSHGFFEHRFSDEDQIRDDLLSPHIGWWRS